MKTQAGSSAGQLRAHARHMHVKQLHRPDEWSLVQQVSEDKLAACITADNRRLSVVWVRTTSTGAPNDPRARRLSIYVQICPFHFLLSVLTHSNTPNNRIMSHFARRLKMPLVFEWVCVSSSNFIIVSGVQTCIFKDFWLFPGLLCSYFCFFILFGFCFFFCYHAWLFTGRPSLRCQGGFLIICIHYLKVLSAVEFN